MTFPGIRSMANQHLLRGIWGRLSWGIWGCTQREIRSSNYLQQLAYRRKTRKSRMIHSQKDVDLSTREPHLNSKEFFSNSVTVK